MLFALICLRYILINHLKAINKSYRTHLFRFQNISEIRATILSIFFGIQKTLNCNNMIKYYQIITHYSRKLSFTFWLKIIFSNMEF